MLRNHVAEYAQRLFLENTDEKSDSSLQILDTFIQQNYAGSILKTSKFTDKDS